MIEILLLVALGYSIAWVVNHLDKVKEILGIIKREDTKVE